MSNIDRLERLEASLTKSVAGFLSDLRITGKTRQKDSDMNEKTIPTEVAAIRKPAGVIETHHADGPTEWGYSFTDHNPEPADYVRCYDEESAWKLARRIESALTKAEAVEPVAEVYEWHTCGRDALGEAYRQSKGVAMRFIGPALPIGTKLYAHAPPAAPKALWKYQHEETGRITETDVPPEKFIPENPRWYSCPPPAEPVASVPDGWAAPNALTEEMIEAADDAHVAAYSDPSVPVSLEALHRAIYEAFRGASPGKIQGCGGCEGRGVVTDGDLSGDIWKAQCRGCNGRGWHVDAALSTTPSTNQEGAAP